MRKEPFVSFCFTKRNVDKALPIMKQVLIIAQPISCLLHSFSLVSSSSDLLCEVEALTEERNLKGVQWAKEQVNQLEYQLYKGKKLSQDILQDLKSWKEKLACNDLKNLCTATDRPLKTKERANHQQETNGENQNGSKGWTFSKNAKSKSKLQSNGESNYKHKAKKKLKKKAKGSENEKRHESQQKRKKKDMEKGKSNNNGEHSKKEKKMKRNRKQGGLLSLCYSTHFSSPPRAPLLYQCCCRVQFTCFQLHLHTSFVDQVDGKHHFGFTIYCTHVLSSALLTSSHPLSSHQFLLAFIVADENNADLSQNEISYGSLSRVSIIQLGYLFAIWPWFEGFFQEEANIDPRAGWQRRRHGRGTSSYGYDGMFLRFMFKEITALYFQNAHNRVDFEIGAGRHESSSSSADVSSDVQVAGRVAVASSGPPNRALLGMGPHTTNTSLSSFVPTARPAIPPPNWSFPVHPMAASYSEHSYAVCAICLFLLFRADVASAICDPAWSTFSVSAAALRIFSSLLRISFAPILSWKLRLRVSTHSNVWSLVVGRWCFVLWASVLLCTARLSYRSTHA